MMQSTKSEVEEFSKSNPNFKGFLCDYIKKGEEQINNEIKNLNKKELIKRCKTLYNVAKFKKTFIPAFKFKVELLKNNNSDFKVFEESLNLNKLDNWKTENTAKIYRIISTDNCSKESKTSSGSQFLLLHGTKAPNVEGILKKGFNPSKRGTYGPGVYFSNSIKYAYGYGAYKKGYCVARDQGIVKCLRYIFVNQLNQTDVQASTNGFKGRMSYDEYLTSNPEVQLYRGYTRKSVTFVDSIKDKFDSKNNKISGGTFLNDKENHIIGVAHHDLVTPVYLIEVEERFSLKEVAQKILYQHLRVCKYVEEDEVSAKSQNTSAEECNVNKVKEYTLEKVTKELEKEIDSNQQAKLKALASQLDDDIHSIMEQLTFKLSSIIETTNNKNRKYKAERLDTENVDYKFILCSIADKNAENKPKIMHVFKINPVDKTEVVKMKDKCLYLKGIKSNKVNNTLTFGYPFKQHNLIDNKLHYNNHVFSFLGDEIEEGLSYCEVDNAVKKLSFVFVASSETNYKGFCLKGSDILRDSRGSCAAVGLFSNEHCILKAPISASVPAYLIVFELE